MKINGNPTKTVIKPNKIYSNIFINLIKIDSLK